MQNTVKSDEAERAITTVIYDRVGRAVVDSVSVTSSDDAIGEPSFFVTVYLKNGRDRPKAEKTIEMIKAMRDALFDLDDDRFPHLSFRAPEDEESEDTRPER